MYPQGFLHIARQRISFGGLSYSRKRFDMLTKAEAAERLGVTPNFVAGLIKCGKLRAVTLGPRTVRVPEAEIDRLMNGAA